MNSRIRVFALFLAVFGISTSPSSWAGSVLGTGGSTEVTQLANQVQLIQAAITQAQQLSVALQQATTNPNTPFSQTMQELEQLRSVYNTAQGVGYSLQSVNQNFTNLYPGFGTVNGNIQTNITNWQNQTRNTVQSAMQTAGWTMDQVASSDQMIETLRSQSQSAQGQMQATQAGNAIAVEMVQQLRSLSQLQAASSQAQASYMAGVNEKSTQDQAVHKQFYQVTPVSETGQAMPIN
ncbi:P-type conjugative transfer protein TrbJ [Burkholderia sp. L27(2015)]|uniref:P-type conjugative transfer protein TrbJ n=1 Tax=Burkholderia sp. L27(2015) TaxID=1641858 RepID=UPI00131E1664|nr:P-type conjugative transfer protein TrbJ [Burkholderia sp. L27(2015)]